MKRYLVFYGSIYYPVGGMNDFIGDFDTKEDAIKLIETTNEKEDDGDFEYRWANVWDSKDRIEIYSK